MQSAEAEAPLPAQWHYKKAAALPQAAPAYERAHFVQLPPQQTTYLSYQEHEGCGCAGQLSWRVAAVVGMSRVLSCCSFACC